MCICNFLQSSAGTTPIYEHLKTMQEMMQHECHKLGATWGVFGHEFTKNRVVPALLFFLPPLGGVLAKNGVTKTAVLIKIELFKSWYQKNLTFNQKLHYA